MLCAFIAFTTVSKAQSKLEIVILDLRNSKGEVGLKLVDENEKLVHGIKSKIKNKKCVITFKDIPDGKYAVQYFHDENSDDKIEKNRIGMPKEGYGFSNDAHGKFGPKKFEKWLFTIKGDTKIKVKTKYWF